MKEVLQMTFRLDNDKEHIVSLLGPKAGLADTAVRPVMQAMVDKHFIIVNGAELSGIKGAVIVKTQTTKLI